MVLEHQPLPFLLWLGPALWEFFTAALVLGGAALALSFLVMAFRYGPLAAGDIIYRAARVGFIELVQMSPRRIWALARLAIQESLRRRVLAALAVFVLILLFTNWFLDNTTDDPAKLYLSFVLNTTTQLVLVMALFLSAFSLPLDIKNRTIYSVVTKPVRPGEILLGRILGFSLIGTVLLAVMGLFSYMFVVRALSHTHEVEVAELKPASGKSEGQLTGRTSQVQGHRHQLTIHPDGTGSTDVAQGHWHDITSYERDGNRVYELSNPQGMFAARVPLYGDLRFLDRDGQPVEKGVSVGAEWSYRSYIEGGSQAAAIWTFHDVSDDKFREPGEDQARGLPLEMLLRVFRTHKGNIEKGIGAIFKFRNPKTGRESSEDGFSAKDNQIDQRFYPREMRDPNNKPIDLFDDLVSDDGDLEVWVRCRDAAQYFGVAKADMYVRASDTPFYVNFIKGYIGSWLKMVLVTSIGVMFSTFLTGPVAMLGTMAAIILGFFSQFIVDLASGTIKGGGPIESLIRIVKQQNVMIEMEPGLTTTVVKTLDGNLIAVLQRIAKLLPNFREINNLTYVAEGFDVPADLVLTQCCATLGYLAAVFVIGYFFLKTREIAR